MSIVYEVQGLYVPSGEELLKCIPTRSVISQVAVVMIYDLQEAAINALMSQICAINKTCSNDFILNHPSDDLIQGHDN